MDLLLMALLGLAGVTIVGHLIWRVIAAVFGFRVQTVRSDRRQTAPPAVNVSLVEELDRLVALRLLDPATRQRVLTALHADQKHQESGSLRWRTAASPPPLPAIPLEPPLAPPPIPSAALEADAIDVIEEEPGAAVPGDVQTVQPPTPASPFGAPAPPPFVLRPPPPPPRPRRTFAQVFAAFMEDRNIRWGELLGGLLIIGCSIALVISFWSEIAQRPVFKFSLFTAVTAALFGVGLYSEHRWKLPTTSRGILIIATLLVPLNFMALAAMSGIAPQGAVAIGAQIAALALFAALLWQAAKVLSPAWPINFTLGLAALSACVLSMRALVPAQRSASGLMLAALLPAACYGGGCVWMLWTARRWRIIRAAGAEAMLLLLGVLSFAVALAIGLLVSGVADVWWALGWAAPVISLCGLPALATGWLIWQRTRARRLARQRLAGTTVGVIGALVMLAGLVLGWPNPAAMLPAAIVNFVAFTAIAILLEIPAAHLPALVCLVCGWVLGFDVVRGAISWSANSDQVARAIFHPANGAALAVLVLLIAAADYGLRRIDRPRDARMYRGFVWAPVVLSIALLNTRGFGTPHDPFGATWVYAVYALLAFFFAALRENPKAGWAGWTLALAALAQAFVAHQVGRDPWLTALLACALIAAAAGVAAEKWKKLSGAILIPARFVQLLAAAVAAGVALLDVVPGIFFELDPSSANSSLSLPLAFHALGTTTWVMLAALAALLAIESLRAASVLPIYALILTTWCACPLWAQRYNSAGAAMSMFRWAAAGYLVSAFVVQWILEARWNRDRPELGARRNLWGTLLAFAIVPVVFFAALGVAGAAADGKARVPAGNVWLAKLSPSASYSLTIVVVSLVLAGFGLRKRRAGYGSIASFFGCLAFSAGYLMYSLGAPAGADIEGIRLIEGNAIVLCAVALGWLLSTRLATSEHAFKAPAVMTLQASLGAILVAALLAIMTCAVVFTPDRALPASQMADVWGIAAVGLAILGILVPRLLLPDAVRVKHVAASLLMLAAMAGCVAAIWNRSGFPMGLNALLAGTASSAWLIFALGAWTARRLAGTVVVEDSFAPEGERIQLNYQRLPMTVHQRIVARLAVKVGDQPLVRTVVKWSAIIGVLAVVLSLVRAVGGAEAQWWAVPATLSIAALCTILACWAWMPGLLYSAMLLTGVGVDLFYLLNFDLKASGLSQFFLLNVMALALPGIASLVLELQVFRKGGLPSRGRLPAHRAASIGALVLFAIILLLGVFGALVGNRLEPDPIYALAAIGSLAALCIALLWDVDSRAPLVMLYATGLMSIALWLESSSIGSLRLIFFACWVLAGFALLVAVIFRMRDRLIALARRLGVPTEGRVLWIDWLPMVQACVAAAVIVLAFGCQCASPDAWMRWIAGAAALSQGLVFVLLSDRTSTSALRQVALLLAAAGAAALSWAPLPPEPMLLERAAALLVAWLATDAIYFLLLPRLLPGDSPWHAAARSAAIPIAIAAALALAFTLATELDFTLTIGHVPMHAGAIAIVLIALLGASGGALWSAIRNLTISEKRRIQCVYAAEGLLALAFVHARLTMPFLFGGVLAAYWPLVVMAIAFVGVGAGELLRRRGNRILSEPIGQTGVFLPLLPVIAFWMLPAGVDLGTLLVTVCVFYGIVAALRRSFAFAMLAVLAGNGALWRLLAHSPGFAFLEHPQVWLIPIALSVLAAAQLNRHRLSREQLSLVRYACLIVVYVSSTADVFLNGVATAPWLPLVLAAISVAGIMAGLLLRIRPFLYLGTAFLLLSVVTMIYYASAQLHWTWIWYVAGIALGIAILTLFALFEKKRSEMTAMVEGLKQWQ